MPTDVDTNFLFPAPSAHHWPGVTPGSTQTLRDVLQDNHKRWHIFFNDKRFHNHSAHRAIAIWALGADSAVIRAAYEIDCKEQRASYTSPGDITEENFETHLSDPLYYDAYLKYFTGQVREHGIDNILEKFIFSKKYNEGKTSMLGLFYAQLVHPMIHIGYGAEFKIPGIFIEGLAQACVHRPDNARLLPTSFLESLYAASENVASPPNPATNGVSGADKNERGSNVHALSILARVIADSRFDIPQGVDVIDQVQHVIGKHSDLIREYALQWTIDIQKPGEVDRKAEEISWMTTIMYGIAGWTWAQGVKGGKDNEFNADFFLLHLLTSGMFVPSLLARLRNSPQSQLLLLRCYMVICLTWYVARGRPQLDVQGFFTSTASAYPLPINPLPTPHKDALPGQDKIQARVPNPWLPLVQTTLVHPDSHLPKGVRTLSAWASKFGTTPAGTFAGPSKNVTDKAAIQTELPGAEYLDGSLFIRVAGLTVARMGRVGQGEAALDFWDVAGFSQ